MNIEYIRKEIKVIAKKCEKDHEFAHARESGLRHEFLMMLADSDSEYSEMAKELLTTDDLDFLRFYG